MFNRQITYRFKPFGMTLLPLVSMQYTEEENTDVWAQLKMLSDLILNVSGKWYLCCGPAVRLPTVDVNKTPRFFWGKWQMTIGQGVLPLS